MSAKYQLANNTTVGDRLLNVGAAVWHLTTGDCVELVNDPSQADPLKISLQLVVGHTAPATIATLNSGGSGHTFYTANPASECLTLCGDANDNLYVFGPYGGPTTLGRAMVYQAFIKQPGILAWTPAPAQSSGAMSPANTIIATSAIWCNTGGGTNGAGHLLVIANTNIAQSGAFIFDAGKVLTGAAAVVEVTTNPAFLGTGLATTAAGGNLDLDADSLFASTGMAVSAGSTANQCVAGAWGVSATGHLTTGGGNVKTISCGTLSATTQLRIVARQDFPTSYGLVVPSAATAGQLSVYSVSSAASAGPSGPTDSGTASNFPTPSATLSWDVTAGSAASGEIWIYAWSSATPTTMLRLPFTFGLFEVPVLGTVVTDDTTVGSGTNTTIRIVADPVDYSHIDWQAYDTVTPFSLLGDYSALPPPPNTPTLVSPVNASSIPLATGGVLDWLFTSPQVGDAQVSYALQRQLAGAAPEWWNAGSSSWQSSEIFNTSSVTQVTFASGKWTASSLYTWSVAVTGVGGTSAYSQAWLLGTYAAPTAPTLSVSYDATNTRNVLIVDGSVSTAPTGSIEFSDDGGVTWQFVYGASALPNVYPGPLTVYDMEVGSQATRQYRARNWATAPLLNYSSYATASQAAPAFPSFALKDLLTATAIAVLQKASTYAPSGNFSRSVRQPIGRTNAVVVSDVTHGRTYAVTYVTDNVDDFNALNDLLDIPRPLFWQDPIEASKYVFVTSWTTTDVASANDATYTLHEHAVTFVAVDRPTP